MTENEKIHLILEYICSKENQYGFESDEIAANINLTVPETNILIRKIIGNGDANGCNDNDTRRKGAECILRITATKDAFETKKYLTQGNKEPVYTVKREFINNSRLNELRNISSTDYDLVKFIKLCEEINDNYKRGNYLSVGMIGRTILHHIPPIFKYTSFNEVCSNYGGGPKINKSFKESMVSLKSTKSISDRFLHQMIRKKETLPNATQVNFHRELDVLLEEIIRILK